MEPIKFKGANVVYGANQKEYNPLPAQKDAEDVTGKVTTMWRLSDDELEAIKESGVICLEMLTFNEPLQPVILSVANKNQI